MGNFIWIFLSQAHTGICLKLKRHLSLTTKTELLYVKSTWCQTNPDELAHYTIYNNYEDVVSVVTAQRMDGFYGQLNAMNQIDFIAK